MEKKKILILTSTGGGGHLAVSNALEQQLNSDYEVDTVNIFNDLLCALDPIRFITFNRSSCEDAYNFFIPKKRVKTLSLFYYFGIWYLNFRKKRINTILHDYCIQTKPSLIISVIPLINSTIADVAQKLNIPFLLIPTDLDISMYIHNINKPSDTLFKICLPFHDETIINPLKKAAITDNHIAITGAPLRSEFFTPKNKALLKSEFNIPHDKPVIMILMGAQGSHEAERFTAELIKIEQPVHLIVCFGKNGTSKQALSALTIPTHITISPVSFTARIADYMAISDLLLTKSGTTSVCEAITSNLPMLLDATSAVLPWEQFNHVFIEKHNFGNKITHYTMIEPTVSALLFDKEKLEQWKRNLEMFNTKNKTQKIEEIVRRMLK